MTLREAVQNLLRAMPRCVRCETRLAVVYNQDRFALCEQCWNEIAQPTELPLVDLRFAIVDLVQAVDALGMEPDDTIR